MQKRPRGPWVGLGVLALCLVSLSACETRTKPPSGATPSPSAKSATPPAAAETKPTAPLVDEKITARWTDAQRAALARVDELVKQRRQRTAEEPPTVPLPGGDPYVLNGEGELTQLNLSYTPTTDDDLATLAALTGIEYIDLTGTQVTDAGVQHLSQLPRLGSLSLSRTQVSDASVDTLSAMSRLMSVSINHTKVTDEGLERLKAALPSRARIQ